jgi:hypothetical protein
MAIGSTALAHFLIVLVIGVVVGLMFNRYGRSWLARFGTTAHSDLTRAFVGVAGAFVGFHMGVVMGRLTADVVRGGCRRRGSGLWMWRGR